MCFESSTEKATDIFNKPESYLESKALSWSKSLDQTSARYTEQVCRGLSSLQGEVIAPPAAARPRTQAPCHLTIRKG